MSSRQAIRRRRLQKQLDSGEDIVCALQKHVRRTGRMQCMAVCKSTGKRCKNNASVGFSTRQFPLRFKQQILKRLLPQLRVHGVSQKSVDCCMFCGVHKSVLDRQIKYCSLSVCRFVALQAIPRIIDRMSEEFTGLPKMYSVARRITELE